MQINSDDADTFMAAMTYEEAQSWLMGDTADLSIEANGAIDEAASFARDNRRAFVIIEIKK